MKKVSIDVWIQLIGMLGVLGGLVFVGLEMRQSQQIALAAQHQARTEMFLEQVNTHTEAGLAFRNYNQDQLYVALNQLYGNLLIFENDFVQFQLGLMEEELWENKKGVIRLFGGICEMQEILQEDLPKELLDLFEEGRSADGCRPVLDLFSRLNQYLDF